MDLTNASAIFMQTINNLFMDLLDKEVVVFFPDDVPIYRTIEEYFELLEMVFTYLPKHTFYCKLKKYSFLNKITTFLGFSTTPERMCISDTKILILKEWQRPATT